ncbi:MAG: hypothetical protein ACRCZJ_06860 [Erysipelotrichaceae bacterium]
MNLTYFKYYFKQNWQLLGVMSLILFASMNIPLFISTADDLSSTLQSSVSITTLIILVASIVIPLFNLNYLFSKKALDFYHSMPIPKQEILVGRSLFGLLVVLLPTLLLAGLSSVIVLTKGNDISLTSYWMSIFHILLGYVVLYSLSSFLASKNNNLVDASITTIAWLNLPYILFLLFNGLLSLELYGFSSATNSNMEQLLSPFFLMLQSNSIIYSNTLEWLNWTTYAYWIVIAIGFAIFTYRSYPLRKSEDAEDINTSVWFYPIITYSITCFALMLTFATVTWGSKSFIQIVLPTTLILIVFLLARFVSKRSLEAFLPALKTFALLILAAIVGLSGVRLSGGFGYESQQPKREDITSINIKGYFEPNYLTNYFSEPFTLQEKESIDAIYNLHTELIDNRDAFSTSYSGNTGYLEFEYQLQNNETLTRSYRFPKLQLSYETIRTINNLPELNAAMFATVQSLTSASFDSYFEAPGFASQLDWSRSQQQTFLKLYQEESKDIRFDTIYLENEEYLGSLYLYAGTLDNGDALDYGQPLPLYSFMEKTTAYLATIQPAIQGLDLQIETITLAFASDNPNISYPTIFRSDNFMEFMSKDTLDKPTTGTQYNDLIQTSVPKAVQAELLALSRYTLASPDEPMILVIVTTSNGDIVKAIDPKYQAQVSALLAQ